MLQASAKLSRSANMMNSLPLSNISERIGHSHTEFDTTSIVPFFSPFHDLLIRSVILSSEFQFSASLLGSRFFGTISTETTSPINIFFERRNSSRSPTTWIVQAFTSMAQVEIKTTAQNIANAIRLIKTFTALYAGLERPPSRQQNQNPSKPLPSLSDQGLFCSLPEQSASRRPPPR